MFDKQTMKERAVSETKRLAVIVGYLWVLFAVFEIHKFIILRQQNMAYALDFKLGAALFNAFIIGKIIFTADVLKVGHSLKTERLIYLILCKSALFAAILTVFEILEEGLVGMYHGKAFVESVSAGGGFLVFLSLGMIAFVTLIPFFAYREISTIVGQQQLTAILFAKGTSTKTLQPEAQQESHKRSA